MDPVCAAAVREAFFQLFADGLIYRGKRLVNWDPVTQTALDEALSDLVLSDSVKRRLGLVGHLSAIPIDQSGQQPQSHQVAEQQIQNKKSYC